MGDAAGTQELTSEAVLFGRYLAETVPSAYVVQAYLRAHTMHPERWRARGFDGVLLRLARRGVVRARAADVYARFCRPRTVLRKKLVLLLAILESTHAGSLALDTVPVQGAARFLARAAAAACSSLCLFACAWLWLTPQRILHGSAGRTAGDTR